MSLHVIDLGGDVLFAHIPKTGGTSIRHDRTIASSLSLGTPAKSWPAMPSLTFLRDPFDRVASAWRDFRYLRNMTVMDFDGFVDRYVVDGQELYIRNAHTIDHHTAPMTHSIHGLEHATWIGRYTRLQQDLDEFCRIYNRTTFKLPHYRKSNHDIAVPRTRSLVRKIELAHEGDYQLIECIGGL